MSTGRYETGYRICEPLPAGIADSRPVPPRPQRRGQDCGMAGHVNRRRCAALHAGTSEDSRGRTSAPNVRPFGNCSLHCERDYPIEWQPEEFRPKFRDRIDPIAGVQRLLSRIGESDRVTFDELIHSQIATIGSAEEVSGRVTLDGPSAGWPRAPAPYRPSP